MNLDPSNQIELFGHENEFVNLTKLYLNKKLPNKILFSGEKGIGKSTLAYHLINFILSTGEEFSYDVQKYQINPDNKSYKLLQNRSNPNFILVDIIDEKKNIDINQIRNLILTLNKSSFNTKPRLVLIDNIESLNTNAVNALLKVLEEPNENINFILINNNKKILPTLKSRCLDFKINLSHQEAISITNKILNNDYKELINEELVNNYKTPGNLLRLINFGNIYKIDLKDINLNNLFKTIMNNNIYKKDNSIKILMYNLIENYFRINVSVNNIKLIKYHKYFLKKINDTKLFNLDDESIFMEFDDKILNG